MPFSLAPPPPVTPLIAKVAVSLASYEVDGVGLNAVVPVVALALTVISDTTAQHHRLKDTAMVSLDQWLDLV